MSAPVTSTTNTQPSQYTTYASNPEQESDVKFLNIVDGEVKDKPFDVPSLSNNFGFSTLTKTNAVRMGCFNIRSFNLNENSDGTNLTQCMQDPAAVQDSTQRQITTMIAYKQSDMSLRGWKDALNQQGFNCFIMPKTNPKPWEDKFQLVVFDQNNRDISDAINKARMDAIRQQELANQGAQGVPEEQEQPVAS